MKILFAFLVSIFSLSSLSSFGQVPPHMRCEMKPAPTCVDAVNSDLSRWDIRDEDVQRRLYHACAGNVGSACVNFSKENLPWYDLNDADEMLRIAKSCKLTEVSCLQYVKSRLARYEYNEPNEIFTVNVACARAEGSCVKAACDSRRFRCSDKEGLLQAARSCFKRCWPRD